MWLSTVYKTYWETESNYSLQYRETSWHINLFILDFEYNGNKFCSAFLSPTANLGHVVCHGTCCGWAHHRSHRLPPSTRPQRPQQSPIFSSGSCSSWVAGRKTAVNTKKTVFVQRYSKFSWPRVVVPRFTMCYLVFLSILLPILISCSEVLYQKPFTSGASIKSSVSWQFGCDPVVGEPKMSAVWPFWYWNGKKNSTEVW